MGAKYRSDELLGRDVSSSRLVFSSLMSVQMAAQQQPSEEDILAFLRGQDAPLSGKLVGQKMGFQGRKNVNTQLHSLEKKGLVRKDGTKQPPEWSAVGGVADRGTPPPQPSPTALNRPIKIEGKPVYTHESGPDGKIVFSPVRAGDLSQPLSQPSQAEASPQQESGALVVTSPTNPPSAEVPNALERNHSTQTAQSQSAKEEDDRVSVLAQNFEGIDLSGDSSDPPSTLGGQQDDQQPVKPTPKPRSRLQPSAEERETLRVFLQQSEAPLSMFDLYTHLGHSTRSVAKTIIQELEKEGHVRKIEGSDSEPDKWEWVRE